MTSDAVFGLAPRAHASLAPPVTHDAYALYKYKLPQSHQWLTSVT